MTWRRHVAKALPAVVVAPIFFVVARAVPQDASALALTVAAVAGIALAILGLYLARRVEERLLPAEPWPTHLQTLRKILHATVQSEHTPIAWTTVEEYASYEDRLRKGDTVYVLTHDLYMYDAHSEALRAVALNLLEEVRYRYVLDQAACGHMREAFGAKLRAQVEAEVRLQSARGAGVADEMKRISDALRRVEFFELREPLIYPFSITQRVGQWSDAHWFAIGKRTEGATPKTADDVVRLVVLYVTSPEHILALENLFRELVRKPWSRPLPPIPTPAPESP
jgi:hypothetical protein